MFLIVINCDQDVKIDSVSLKVLGKSGKIRLGTPDFNVQLWIKNIEERTINDKLIRRINNIDEKDFFISELHSYELNTTNGNLFFPRTSLILEELNLETQYWIINKTVDIYYGNNTISVNRNQIKISILLDNWNFENVSNNLYFTMKLLQVGSKQNNYKKDKHKLIFDTCNLDLSTVVIVDGYENTIEYNINKDEDAYIIEWKFPYFQKTLFYDPTLSLQSPEIMNAASIYNPITNVFIVFNILLIFLL